MEEEEASIQSRASMQGSVRPVTPTTTNICCFIVIVGLQLLGKVCISYMHAIAGVWCRDTHASSG